MKTGNPAIDSSDATHIIASDECGYGSWAGPLCIGVVCVPKDWVAPKGLTDSKKLSKARHVALDAEFTRSTDPNIKWAVHTFDHDDIDRTGVGKLLRWGHEQAIESMVSWCQNVLKGRPLAIVDGNMKIAGAISLVKADELVPACSMASVIGKVYHDKLMAEWAELYPEYDFANNVGYRSPKHIEALERLGPSPIHRKSYSVYDQYKKSESPQNMWDMSED